MIKPIALFKISKRFNHTHACNISKQLTDQLTEDFHVVVISAEVKDVELQVFYEKDIQVKTINEINKLITGQTS